MDPSYKVIFFKFTDLFKNAVSIFLEEKIVLNKDYLSKDKNIEKYIYEACEAIQIVAVSYIKYEREISQYSNEELNKSMGEICGRNYEIEARLAYRRILELFIESFHFSKIIENKEEVFRYFFLIKNLKAFYSRNKHSEDICDISLQFDKKVISEIRKELNSFSLKDVPFYIAVSNGKNKDFNKDNDIKDLIKGYSTLFKESVVHLSESQRLALGNSYQSYSETSEVVHGYSGGPKFDLKYYHQEMLGLYAKMYSLTLDILKQLILIGGDKINNTELVESIKSLKTEMFNLSIGHVVMVKNEVKAKIIDTSVSKNGCRKYKVEYIDKRDVWSFAFDEEWFLFKDLRKVL